MLREIADTIDGIRYWYPQIFAPAACRDIASGKRLEWKGVPIRYAATKAALLELCSIVVDLDVGREERDRRPGAGMTADQAIESVRQLVADGALPRPSLIARSGRGVYLVYLLTKSHEGKRVPVRNSPEARAEWKRVVSSLGRIVDHIGYDGASNTLPRGFKAPGRAGEPATYYAVAENPAGIRYWTLRELAGALPPEPERVPEPLPKSKGNRRQNRGKRDPSRPVRLRIKELEALAECRGGIAEGNRHNFLVYYTTDLRRLYRLEGMPWPEALARTIERALALNRTFRPPLDDYEVRSLVRADSSFKVRHRNQTISQTLNITELEMMALGLRCLLPPRVAKEREASRAAKRTKKREQRELLDAMIHSGASTSEIMARTGYSKSKVCARRRKLTAGRT